MSDAFENLAILIPTRNRPEILATTLVELQKAGLGAVALWVYDDCSADAGANVMRDTSSSSQQAFEWIQFQRQCPR